MDKVEPQTYYELLNISKGATREEIENACLALWYKNSLLRGTPIWGEISGHIEKVHSTLVDPASRIAYDQSLIKNSPSGLGIAYEPHFASFSMANKGEHKESSLSQRSIKWRKVIQPNALVAAIGFNQSIDWIGVKEWADLLTSAALAFAFCIAAAVLVLSIIHLMESRAGHAY